MEHVTVCAVCFQEYNSETVIPLVLDCGHTFCKKCVSNIIDFIDKRCPKCRATIPGDKRFPVNYVIINLIDQCKKTKKDYQDIPFRIQNLKEKLNCRLSTIKNEISEKSDLKNIIEYDLKSLISVEKENLTEGPKRKKAVTQLGELEKKFEELCSPSSCSNLNDLEVICNFSLKRSQTSEAFLRGLYQALKKSEKVFAMKTIDKKLKFGELIARDNTILIYSLVLDKIPDGAKTVTFQDLKECVKNKTFNTFLEITGRNETSHLIIIKLEDVKLCPNFIKLCTGEKGPSYHSKSYSKEKTNTNQANNSGHNYYYGPNYQTTSAILTADISKGLPSDYYKNISKSVLCTNDEVIVTERPNDGFQLQRIVGQSNFEIIGKVIFPSKIWDYISADNSPTPRILGCGILIEL